MKTEIKPSHEPQRMMDGTLERKERKEKTPGPTASCQPATLARELQWSTCPRINGGSIISKQSVYSHLPESTIGSTSGPRIRDNRESRVAPNQSPPSPPNLKHAISLSAESFLVGWLGGPRDLPPSLRATRGGPLRISTVRLS